MNEDFDDLIGRLLASVYTRGIIHVVLYNMHVMCKKKHVRS